MRLLGQFVVTGEPGVKPIALVQLKRVYCIRTRGGFDGGQQCQDVLEGVAMERAYVIFGGTKIAVPRDGEPHGRRGRS